jgi:hypothetical protein
MQKIAHKSRSIYPLLVAMPFICTGLFAQNLPGEGPALGTNRVTQNDIVNGVYTHQELRKRGREIFSTPFNILDGLGEGERGQAIEETLSSGPYDPPTTHIRPTLQNNGIFLRVDGLDSQTCLECHGILSNKAIPSKFGVGGVGGVGANAMGGATEIDVTDELGLGYAFYNGRFINPPFLFGSGGVELLAREINEDILAFIDDAKENPGTTIQLNTHGVSFGSIVYRSISSEFEPANGGLNVSNVQGLETDPTSDNFLQVAPFGRKGEFKTTRDFDVGAMQFHFGMQPVEVPEVGTDDADGDGISNEILVGELSAMHIFSATMERPFQEPTISTSGYSVFNNIGCANCHIPTLTTESRYLPLDDPDGTQYYTIDLTATPTSFTPSGTGVAVPLFSDLKRHNMGPGLAEETGGPLDPFFITARLWGVADTAPYLHDGRASTLSEAILLHGGEAELSSKLFKNLSNSQKIALLNYLRTLRTPTSVGTDLD